MSNPMDTIRCFSIPWVLGSVYAHLNSHGQLSGWGEAELPHAVSVSDPHFHYAVRRDSFHSDILAYHSEHDQPMYVVMRWSVRDSGRVFTARVLFPLELDAHVVNFTSAQHAFVEFREVEVARSFRGLYPFVHELETMFTGDNVSRFLHAVRYVHQRIEYSPYEG